MQIPEKLKSLYTAELIQEGDSYQIEIPNDEVELGDINPTQTYRIAILPSHSSTSSDGQSNAVASADSQNTDTQPQPPVSEGETRIVDIEDIGEQGDGITRVERGYVVIVPEATKGDRAEIKIETVKRNVAFATVVEYKNSEMMR